MGTSKRNKRNEKQREAEAVEMLLKLFDQFVVTYLIVPYVPDSVCRGYNNE